MEAAKLVDRVKKLKTSLEEIEKQIAETRIERDVLEDFKTAVDHTRMTVWGILTTPDANLREIMAHFRIKHTIDMCNRIVVDLCGQVDLDPTQLQKFRATLEYTLERLKQGY